MTEVGFRCAAGMRSHFMTGECCTLALPTLRAGALMCLKKKKMYEGQRTTLDNTKFAMEQQVCPPVPQYFRLCAALPADENIWQ